MFSIQATNESISFCDGWGVPGGGIRCPRSLRRGFLPDLRVIRGGFEVQSIERKATGLQARVVAGDTVGIEERPMRIRDGCAGLSRRSLPLRFKKGERNCQNHESACAKQMLHKLQPIGGSIISAGLSSPRPFCFYHKTRSGTRAPASENGHPCHRAIRSQPFYPRPANTKSLRPTRVFDQVQDSVHDGGFRAAGLQARRKHFKGVHPECCIIRNIT